MQKSFTTQTDLFISASALDHPILHSLDDTEALLEWGEIERVAISDLFIKDRLPQLPTFNPVPQFIAWDMVSTIRCETGSMPLS